MTEANVNTETSATTTGKGPKHTPACLLYTSDAADE